MGLVSNVDGGVHEQIFEENVFLFIGILQFILLAMIALLTSKFMRKKVLLKTVIMKLEL